MSDDIPDSFGQWVKLRRETLDLTQTELAARISVAPVTLRKYEHNILRPSRSTAERLAVELKIPPEQHEIFINVARKHAMTKIAADVEPLCVGFPVETSSFTGRTAELEKISQDLHLPGCRLLTLLGPGGTGKTRLACQAAQQNARLYPGGTYFVPLASVNSPEAILPAIAAAVHFTFHPGSDPKIALTSYLNEQPSLLLVLDNFEDLLPGAGLLHELLTGAAGLTLLVTSRIVLRLRGEWLMEVKGLDYPSDALVSDAARYGAIKLFSDRARQVKPNFDLANELPALIELCQMLNGNPLALELAAAWTRPFSCEAIVSAVRKTMDFLKVTGPGWEEKHRSIRAVFEQTWQRLSPEEQMVYRRLAVFQGTFSLAAAEKICDASLAIMVSLLDKCLLTMPHPERYQLHELLHQYTQEKLIEAGEEDSVRDRYCQYYTSMVENQLEILLSSRQQEGVTVLLANVDNIRQAWDYALVHHLFDHVRVMARTLLWFHTMKSRFTDGDHMMGDAVRQLEGVAEQPAEMVTLGLVQVVQGWNAMNLGVFPKALTLCRNGLAHIQDNSSLYNYDGWLALLITSYVAQVAGDLDTAIQQSQLLLEIGLQLNTPFAVARSYYGIARTANGAGDFETALRYFRQAVKCSESDGINWGTAHIRLEMGMLLTHLRRYDEALDNFAASLGLFRQMKEPLGTALSLTHLAIATHAAGSTARTWSYLREALGYARDIQAQPVMLSILTEMGLIKGSSQRARAKTWLFRARDHQASWQDVRDRASKYLNDLKLEDERIPVYSQDLMEIVEEILSDGSTRI